VSFILSLSKDELRTMSLSNHEPHELAEWRTMGGRILLSSFDRLRMRQAR